MTSFDIAEKTRVSQTTMSPACVATLSVSGKTRPRVEAAAAAFNCTIFDADFAASDLTVIGGNDALSAHGIGVPFEVAVAGFDDIPMSSFVNPPLTTVQQDTRRAGEMLVDSLLRLSHDEPVESRMLPMKLMVRRSSLWQDVTHSEHAHEG